MTYARFEDLPVWNAAQELAADVFVLLEDRAFDNKGDLRDQLQRSSLSISNNIAEGFERGTTAELLCYLYISRGSAGETRSALRFAHRLATRGVLKSEISNLKSEIRAVVGNHRLIPIQHRLFSTQSRKVAKAQEEQEEEEYRTISSSFLSLQRLCGSATLR